MVEGGTNKNKKTIWSLILILEIFPGVAEELCRNFPQDENIDMTPILRRSKEAARRQRAKPDDERVRAIPTSKPLAGMQFGGGPPRPRPELTRKRRFPEEDYYSGSRPKMPRGQMGRPPPVSRYATAGSSTRSGSGRSYEEYLRNARPSGYGYPPHYPAPPQPRGGYEGRGGYDGYGYDVRSGPQHDRRSYDRSVEEFLRRTTSSHSSDRYRRYDRR